MPHVYCWAYTEAHERAFDSDAILFRTQEARPDKQQLMNASSQLRECLTGVFTQLLQHLLRCSPLFPETGFSSITQYSQLVTIWHDFEWQQVRGLLPAGLTSVPV